MREWLKNERIKNKLSMKQIAEKLDISEGYYCYIENGERQKNMDITLVAKLSSIFCIPIQQIVEFEQTFKSA